MNENMPLQDKNAISEEKGGELGRLQKDVTNDVRELLHRIKSFVVKHGDFVEDYSTLTQFNKWLKREVPVEQQKIGRCFYLSVLGIIKNSGGKHGADENKKNKGIVGEEKKMEKGRREKKLDINLYNALLALSDPSTRALFNVDLCLFEDIAGAFQTNKSYKVSRVCCFIKKYSNFFVTSFNGELDHWIGEYKHESKEITLSKFKGELKTFSESFVRLLETAKDSRLKDDEYRRNAVRSYPHLADQVCCFMDAVIVVDEEKNTEKLESFLRYPLNEHVLDFLDKELPNLELIIKIWQQRPITKILAASLKEAWAIPIQNAEVSASSLEESGIARRRST